MKKSTSFISLDRATIYFFFILYLFAVDLGFIFVNTDGTDAKIERTKDRAWGTELVLLAFGYMIFMFIYLIYLNFRHWITLIFVQVVSVLYFFFVLIYDLVRTSQSTGGDYFYTNKVTIFDLPWIAVPVPLYAPTFLLCSFMLHDEVCVAPPKRALAFERIIGCCYYGLKSLAFPNSKKKQNPSPYLIRLDRDLIYFLYIVFLMAFNIGLILFNIENRQYKYQQREMILMCCFYFLFICGLYLHFCISSVISLVCVQILSVCLFIFQWCYDLGIITHDLGFPHLIGVNTQGLYTQHAWATPVYIYVGLLGSFLLRFKRTLGTPNEQPAYVLEGLGYCMCAIGCFVKGKIFDDESSTEPELDALIGEKIDHDPIELSRKKKVGEGKCCSSEDEFFEKKWIAFERPALYFLFLLFLLGVTMGTILCNMSPIGHQLSGEFGTLESLYLNTELVLMCWLIIGLLIISVWNMWAKDFISLLILQILSVFLFIVIMVYSIILSNQKAISAFQTRFSWTPWFDISSISSFSACFLLASLVVQNEVYCCSKNKFCRYYSLEAIFAFLCRVICRVVPCPKKKCGAYGDNRLEDPEKKCCKKKKCCAESSFIFLDRGALYFLLILFLFSLNLGQIIQNMVSETGGKEYFNTELIVTSLFYIVYVFFIALFLNCRCPFTLIFVQVLSLFLFFFRTIYDLDLSNHTNGDVPTPLTTPFIINVFSGISFPAGSANSLPYYSAVLFLLSFCLKADRLCGCSSKEGGYYALEGIFMMLKCLVVGVVKFIIYQVKKKRDPDSINGEEKTKKGYEYVAILEDPEDGTKMQDQGYGSTDMVTEDDDVKKQEMVEEEEIKHGYTEEEVISIDDEDDDATTSNIILNEEEPQVREENENKEEQPIKEDEKE